MHLRRRPTLWLAIAALLCASAMTATAASASPLLRSSVAPSLPTDPILHEVTPGSAPWVLRGGVIRLSSAGMLHVRVRGLIIPELGTAGPVTSINASLFCANETTPAAVTPTAPLSQKGNGTIEAQVSLPETCLTPVVLINPLGITSIYIATSGFGG